MSVLEHDGRPIVIFQSRLKPSGLLDLVEYPDGSLEILRNGVLVEGCRWKVDQLEKSVLVFRDLCTQAHEQ